ncbi:hypothetical protein [Streptomyces sp. NRRL S-1022]|uniref:hypothetical protein n=1 Tax=Streptomyces sp. NRRL S-1022 TaxID=1463880 RepID=UPI00131D2EAC|nr:hypothetical protein [Streptomyces sp. NRRL S-1022]
MRRFAGLLIEAEVRDLAEHPDPAGLNVQLNGFHGDGRPAPARGGGVLVGADAGGVGLDEPSMSPAASARAWTCCNAWVNTPSRVA